MLWLAAGCNASSIDHDNPEPGAIAANEEASTATPCSDQHRVTTQVGSEQRCGVCQQGYTEAPDRTCIPVPTCASLACAASHRLCEPTPYPSCAEACEPGYVWDESTSACRFVITCDSLECGDGQTCVEATETTDAHCDGARCLAGSGWNGATNSCQTCAGGQSPSCGGNQGETGNVITTDAGQCVCETRPGYFVSTGGAGSAEPCDQDGDGWVNEGAQAAIEGPDAALRANARCSLRRIKQFVLQNEEGDSNAGAGVDLTVGFPGGLPLYESARNDGRGASGDLPAPYGQVGAGKAINSLTKACVDAASDFDDNRIADVDEGSTSPVSTAIVGRIGTTNTTLASYYATYAKYAYFLELAEGWYARPAQLGQPGTYVIQERRRGADPAAVPVHYADATPGYWNQCRRGTDVLYGAQATSRVGGDFTDLALKPPATGMGHEAQFKCVVVYDESRYPANASEAATPELFYLKNGKLARRDPAAPTTPKLYDWVANGCQPAAQLNPLPGVSSKNPLRVAVSCALKAAFDGGGTSGTPVAVAQWAAIPGYDYAGSTYQRGCIDQCQTAGGACGTGASCSSASGGRVCTCNTGFTSLPTTATQIKLAHSGSCLTGAAAGQQVTQQTCGAANQSFTFQTALNGQQRIRDVSTGLCLAVEAMSNTFGVRVIERACADIVEERFDAQVVQGAASTYRLVSNSNVRCLEIANASVANGAGLIQGDCADAAVQFVVPQSGACTQVSACAYDGGGCSAGYTCVDTTPGQRRCDDVNECASGVCGDASHLTCRNTAGSYACDNVNECATNNGGCGNWWQTQCNDYYGGSYCSDINECASNNGGCGSERNERCFNQAPGFRCQYLASIAGQTYGGAGGNWFDIDVDAGRIRGFDIYATEGTGGGVNGITMYYTDNAHYLSPSWQTSMHVGGYGGTYHHFGLDWDDYIIGYFGYSNNMLNVIGFKSHKGYQYGPWGAPYGTYFDYTWSNTPYPIWASGITGKAGAKIDQFGMYFR